MAMNAMDVIQIPPHVWIPERNNISSPNPAQNDRKTLSKTFKFMLDMSCSCFCNSWSNHLLCKNLILNNANKIHEANPNKVGHFRKELKSITSQGERSLKNHKAQMAGSGNTAKVMIPSMYIRFLVMFFFQGSLKITKRQFSRIKAR